MNNNHTMRISSGFSLVELMISLTIGLLISALVASVYVGNHQANKVQDTLARMQENGRFAMQIMARDIQGAGYRGCVPIGTVLTAPPATSFTNLIADSFDSRFKIAVEGNDANAATWSPALDASITGAAITPLAGTDSDVITVRGEEPGSARLTAAPAAASLSVNSVNGLVVNDYALIAQCNAAPVSTIFQISGPANITAATTALSYVSATAISAGTPIGSEIKKMETTTYYIAQPAGATTPSLYRQQGPYNAATNPPQEIVENVAGMQILYGVDTAIVTATGAGSDGVIDEYDTAATVDAVDAVNKTGWNRVRSVKINLLVVSADDNLATTASTYTADGFNYPSDRRLKQGFTTVVTLRNRTL